jgi:catechol 2,3-dioxygenase-like lactoylglutathione lyase family enzyme
LPGLLRARTPAAAPTLAQPPAGGATPVAANAPLELGNFSISLAVKDIAASRAFYEKLGFRVIGGEQAKNWLILQNKTSTIGLFQGPMFTKNMLTFNPGWDRDCNTLEAFDDVRDIQRVLRERGLTLDASAKDDSTGPASIMLTDPDGNPILIDQHVLASQEVNVGLRPWDPGSRCGSPTPRRRRIGRALRASCRYSA